MNQSERSGFTIVELLIVIVIIAILAAITMVAYNGITARAQDSQMKADANSLFKELSVTAVGVGRLDPGYGTTTRAGALQFFGVTNMSDELVICTYAYEDDACEADAPPKDVIYLGFSCGLSYSYWLNADNLWHRVNVRSDTGGLVVQGEDTSTVLYPMVGC